MTTRNLTKRYVELRNSHKANRSLNVKSTFEIGDDSYSDHDHLKPGAESSSSWKATKSNSLPPVWVDDIEKLEETINNIEVKIKELGVLHTKRLMVNFDTNEEEKEQDIDYKTKEITYLFNAATTLLKRFSAQDTSASAVEQSELVVKTNIQRSIAKRLSGLSMSFRRSQKEYKGRLTAQKNEASGGVLAFDDDKKLPGSSNNMIDFEDEGFTQRQRQIVDETSQVVEMRDQEIAHIAKSIEELAQIFRELAVLVIDQGTILDRIDYNMETAVEHAKEGVVQLQVAEETQKKNPALGCIIFLVVLIFILLIIFIVKHSKK